MWLSQKNEEDLYVLLKICEIRSEKSSENYVNNICYFYVEKRTDNVYIHICSMYKDTLEERKVRHE